MGELAGIHPSSDSYLKTQSSLNEHELCTLGLII